MTPAHIADVLEESGRSYTGLLRALPRQCATWHPAEGEWCVNECAGHVIEAERRGFAGRVRLLIAATDPELPGWDPPEVARRRSDCERDPSELANELGAMRAGSVTLVRGLKPELLERSGLHGKVGRLTVNDLIHEWIHHDANHLKQALTTVQAYVWGDMGNARRFAEP